MRTVTVHGKPYNVVYSYHPGRFPQRQHSFTHVDEHTCVEPSGSGRTAKIAWRNFVVAVKHIHQDRNMARLVEMSGKSCTVILHEADYNAVLKAAVTQMGELSIGTLRQLVVQFYSVRAANNPSSLVGDPQARVALLSLVREYMMNAYFNRNWKDLYRTNPPVSVHLHVSPNCAPETMAALGQLVTVACAAADRGEL